MIAGPWCRRSWIAVGSVWLGACVPSDPLAPGGDAPPVTLPAFSSYATGTLSAEAVAEATWEIYGLLWGRAPGTGTGNDDIALRSTFQLASKARTPAASAVRLWLPPGRQIGSLGTMSYRFLMEEGDCGGGSPRLAVIMDADGDGQVDVVAEGLAGPAPSFTGCGTGVWIHEVATDDDPSWEVRTSQGIVQAYVPWDVAVAAVTDLYPDHRVLRIQWIQDSFWAFQPLFTWVDDLHLDGHFLGSPRDLN